MKLIPREKITLETGLSKKEVHQILYENIVSKKTLINKIKGNINDNCFEGFIKDDRFEIQRVVFRKSFVPLLNGHIKSVDNETKVIVEFKIRNFTLVFVIVAFSFILFVFIMGIIGVIKQNVNPILLVFPGILVCFIFILMNITFNGEKEKAIQYLKKTLRANYI